MPGDIGRIPIISLSGCKYLTNIINDLPLPKSTNVPIKCHTLLNDQKFAQEAYRCINCQNEALVGALIKAISSVNNDVQFKDKSLEHTIDCPTSPLLLRALLEKKPDILSGKASQNISRQLEGLSTNELSVSKGSAINRFKTADKQKSKKPKGGSITYNAVSVAPLKISIKKTCTSEVKKTSSSGETLDDNSTIHNIQTGNYLDKTGTCLIRIATHTLDSLNRSASQTLGSTTESQNNPSYLNKSKKSEDYTEITDDPSKPINSTGLVSLNSTINLVKDQTNYTLSDSSANILIDDASRVEVPSTFHTTHSPCEADQLCTEQSPSPKISDLTFGSSGYDTNSAQTRRIPDPALSQIFHSVALFHTYQPTCEPDKGVDNEGGGLFDDWVDAPKLSESPVMSVPTVPNKSIPPGCTSQTPCISSTSAAIKEKLCVCADNETAGSFPRSPLSTLAISSCPTTSGKNIPVSFHNATSAVSISASAVAASLSISKVNTPSPTRLFDSLDETLTTNLSTCSALEEQVNCTPHGLAAYLPRCNNQRINSAHPSVFSNEDVPATFANSVSPRPALSPAIDCIDLNSVSPLEMTVRTSGSLKTIGFSGNGPTTYSKPKQNGRGRFSSGKHRGGGRRRRTELEELKRWSVLDHANPGFEQKNEDLCEVRYSPQNSVTGRDPGTTFAISEASVQTAVSKKDISNLNFSDVCHQYGGFTEALVERVKRRRQQREMESKGFKASPNKETLRSSCEVSPLSTPSPGQSHLKVTSPLRMHKSASLLKRENKKGTQRTTFKTERESQGKGGSISAAVNDYTKLIQSTDSDCSLSPTSTVLSSVQSNSPSMSSVPPINSLQPSPPVLSYQKIDSTSNCHTHNTTVYDRTARSFVPCNVKSPNMASNSNDDVALVSTFSTQANDQDSDFSDAKKAHATSQWKDTKSSTCNYRDPVTVQSFRSRSIHGSCARSNNSSLHLPPLLPLSRYSPSLLHKPLSVDVLESARCQDHVECSMKDMPSPQPCSTHHTYLNTKPSKKPVVSLTDLSFGHLTVDVSSNSNICSSEPSHSVLDKISNTKPETMNSHLCKQFDICPTQVMNGQNVPSNQSEHSESSNSSIASSSPRLFSGIDTACGSDHRCRTPSTIAYTHSSAMEDNDDDSPDVNCRRHDTNLDVGSDSDSSEIKSCSASTDLDAPKANEFGSFSPSSLSSITDDVATIFSDEHEFEHSRQSDYSTSTVLHQFTNRLSKILRRVEELDLLQLAAVVQSKLGTVCKRSSSDQEDSDESCARNNVSSTFPDSARLTKQEIMSLCSDSAKIRFAGSMSTIPTGRLVRFLTLLLVNMQEAASVSPNISNIVETHRISKKRYKYNGEQLEISDNSSTRNGYFTETVLWSDPEWSSSLIGLDCARTALNIIVGPDMPRPLLMEDLIEGIVSVVKQQLDCLIHNIMRVTSHTPHYQSSAVSPSFSILGHVGYRITQIMILLVNLMRLQPNRFTDNLVINLTSLGMAIPSYSLTSGTSITNEWKRFLLSPQKLLNFISHTENSSEFMGSSAKTLGTLFMVSWPEHLQRSSLALLGTLYGQYEAHRKMIVDEIFRTFLSGLDVKRKSAPSVSTETEKIIYPSDRRTAKTFRLLSSSYFYEEYYGSKAKSNVSRSIQSESPQYLYIHALSALFLCITQGLIHTPNLSFPANNCSNLSVRKFPSSAVSTPTQSSFVSEAVTIDNAQFNKDEKHVLSSYSTAVRHAHYLLSGLFKRVSLKAEYDIRSVLETVTNDLLSVTFHAPIEWPASAILLNVLSSLLIQQLNQTNQNANISTNPTTSRSRNTELCGKLLAVDTLASLIVGLKRGAKVYSLDLPSSLFIQNKTHSDLEDGKDNCMKTNKCQTRLIGLLSSPIPIIHHWYFSFYDILQMSNKNDDSNFSEVCERLNLDKNMIYLPDLCSKYYDFLLLTAHRFHLAAWLHNCNRNVPVTNLDIPTGSAKDYSSNSTKNKACVEKLRHQLLAELSLTHLNSPVSGLGFPFAKQNISSLSAACMGCPNSSQHLSSRSRANCICCSGMGWGGSFLAQSMSSQRFIAYTHMPKLCSNMRFRLVAHAHISAVYLLGAHAVLPNFDVLYGFICKLAGESSVPMRSKALRCLALVIDADPKLMSINKDTKNKSTISSSPIFDISNIVRARLLDNSTAVREAAVDLISRYLTLRPQSLAEYYSVIVERVLDKGVSVRKRVIRCFRDLLLNDWNKFLDSSNSCSDGHNSSLIGNQMCTDICLKLIRRLHDENSIQKLITEAFQELWLTPISKSHSRFSKVLDRRIISLASVTVTLRPNNFDLLNTFIVQDLSSGEPHPAGSQFDAACKQIIGRLIVLIKRRIGPLLVPSSKQLIKQSHPMESRKSSQSLSFLSNMHGLMACLHLVSYSKPNLVRPYVGFLMDLVHKICLSVPGTLTSTGQAENQMKPTNTQFLYHLINVVEIVLTEIASNLSESDSPPMEETMFAGVPRTNFFQLQNDLLQFVQRQGRLVVDSALSCLAVLVNQVLKDQTQVICCFTQFYGLLTDLSLELREALSTKISTSARISSKTRPSILRALYTVGLICKYFTLDYSFNRNKKSGMSNSNLLDEVVDILMLFAEYASVRIHVQSSTTFSNPSSSTNDLNNDGVNPSHMKSDMIDPDLCRKAITGLGFLLFRHDQLFCTGSVQLFLTRFLSTVQNSLTNNHPTDGSSFFEIQCIILDNLTHYLLQKERKATADNRLWATRSKRESLKELTDQVTGHSSAVAQTYLPIVLKYCILTPSISVRSSALSLISTILRQGLIHPSHVLSSLICLQTDSDPSIRSRASVCLTEAEQKIPGFAAMRAVSGIRMSHQLQLIIHTNEFSSLIVRGAKDSKTASESKSLSPTNNSTSTVFCINYGLYNMLRTNRQYRRSLIVNLLSIFDEYQKSSLHTTENESIQSRLSQLIFIADHLAHFPYVVLDEVYYVADLIEQRISLIGSTILRSLYRSLLSAAQNKCSNSEVCELSRSSMNNDRKFTSETDLMDFLDKCEANLPREYDFNTSYKYVETMKALDNQISFSSSEKDLQNMFKHCQSDSLKVKARSSMVYAGPSCLLLMTIRKFIREYYGVTYSKLKDYSPSDTSKLWEKPIILTKQSSCSGQLMTLSCIVYQYVLNPGWSDVSKGPPDHILLRHFLVLRRELMLHEDSSLNEQSVKCTSKPNVQISDIENDIKEDCQAEVESGECSTTLCNPSTISKRSKSNSAECLPSVKQSLDSSFNQTIGKSGKQLGKHKIVKRQSSKSSLSDPSIEAVGDTGMKNKEKHSVDLQSQCLISKSIKKHRRLSEHSSYSTSSDSVELNNLRKSQKIGSSRGHQSLLQSSPDSPNKPSFQNQTHHTHFESLDSDANSETNSVDSCVRKNNKIAMISKVKQPSVSNYANQTKKQSTSQSYMQKNTKTKKSSFQNLGVIGHAKSLPHQCRSTNSKQSTGPTRTLAPLPSAMMNSTNTSRPGKHSITNRKTKHDSKRSEFASKYEMKHVSHHFASGGNHHTSRVKNSKSKSLPSKTSHSNESQTHKPHSEEQRTSKKHLSECQSFKMRQINLATKESSIRNGQKLEILSNCDKSEELSDSSESSLSSTSTSLSSSSTSSEDSISSFSSSSSSTLQSRLKQKKKTKLT
ncbi:unnamed protein product [Schistosoma bovis]|nr:unnamed protein product [Schistosoma bovis]